MEPAVMVKLCMQKEAVAGDERCRCGADGKGSDKMFRRKGNSHNNPKTEELQRGSKVKELKVALGSLSERSLRYCTDACLRRYLEARNWNVDKSKKMLEESLKWRSTYKPEEIRWHEVPAEGETGKIYRAGFHDRFGRSVLILRPGMHV